MLRNIIKIDEEKCDGCGLCAEACHEEAIILRDGKTIPLQITTIATDGTIIK